LSTVLNNSFWNVINGLTLKHARKTKIYARNFCTLSGHIITIFTAWKLDLPLKSVTIKSKHYNSHFTYYEQKLNFPSAGDSNQQPVQQFNISDGTEHAESVMLASQVLHSLHSQQGSTFNRFLFKQ
jgi:hypothetical protein